MTEPDAEDFVFTASADPEPNRYACEVCSEPLTYGGRGRKPRFCDVHKKGSSPTTRKRSAGIETLRTQLTSSLAGLGTMLCMVNMFDGTVVVSKSEEVSNALITLAERDPKIRKALEAAMRSGGYLQLAMVMATIIVPIAWNHGLIKGVQEDGKLTRNPELAPLMFGMAGVPFGASSFAVNDAAE